MAENVQKMGANFLKNCVLETDATTLRRKRGSTSLDLKPKVISSYADKPIDSRQQQQRA